MIIAYRSFGKRNTKHKWFKDLKNTSSYSFRVHYLCKVDVHFRHLNRIAYKEAWDIQESLLQANLDIKKRNRERELGKRDGDMEKTMNHFLLCEHNPVFTLGKSGHMENLLVQNDYLRQQGIDFFRTNRGGDITFHGPEQIVGYPILDLELFKPDIVWYMRTLEEMIIQTLSEFGIKAGRSQGETGVWLDSDIPIKARKICAMGVRTSRWVTMHGFALNVNTDLRFFQMIVPCGIQNKQVTSMEKELGKRVDLKAVEEKIMKSFENTFNVSLIT